ncbi:MAG: hypothetical protein ABIQ53_11765, partial [Terracoccus sp.]
MLTLENAMRILADVDEAHAARGTGGNAGSRSATMVVRALVVGLSLVMICGLATPWLEHPPARAPVRLRPDRG